MAEPFDRPWRGIGVGGSLALDFANTLDWRLRDPPEELLHSYPELVRFGRGARVLDPAEAAALRTWGESHRRAAAAALAQAIEIREAIAAVLLAVVHGKPIPASPLARVDAACRAAGEERALRAAGRGAAWGWREGPPAPLRPVWAAALDAARLLTSDLRERVRQCGDAQCGWLFLDASRNRSRRWCTMRGCGNRNKARSFYRRSAARRGSTRG